MDSFRFAQVLAGHAEALSIAAEIEGMKAENSTRERHGQALAYSEAEFAEKAHLLSGVAEYIRGVPHV